MLNKDLHQHISQCAVRTAYTFSKLPLLPIIAAAIKLLIILQNVGGVSGS